MRAGSPACCDRSRSAPIGSIERRSNADAMRELGRRGIVRNELAESLGRAVGFRNVLVHQYMTVDDDIVLRSFGDVARLHEFVREVSAWLTEA